MKYFRRNQTHENFFLTVLPSDLDTVTDLVFNFRV